MLKNNEPALKRLKDAAGYSAKGLRAAYRHEQAFRQEVMVMLVVIPLAIWLGGSLLETLLLIGSWLFVMIVELLNSAVEAVVDRIGTEHHELAGRAKDIGSAAVLFAIALCVMVWVGVIVNHTLMVS